MPFLEQQEFWLSLATIAGGAGAVWAVYAFGRTLTQREIMQLLHQYWELWLRGNPNHFDKKQALEEFADAYRVYLRERNDFWDKYGQVVVAIVIVVVLTVLLLTKTISPEAGLPILSAVGGFAIAKTASISDGNRPRGGSQG